MNTLKQKLLRLGLVVDNEYLDKYCLLIECNALTKYEKFRTNRHHIIPRFYYKYNNLEVDDTINNTVHLLYVDHVLAHFYIYSCISDNVKYYKYAAVCAFIKISTSKNIDLTEKELLDSLIDYQKVYEERRKLQSLFNKLRVTPESRERMRKWNEIFWNTEKGIEIRKRFSKSRTGMAMTQETRNKLSEINKGKQISQEVRNKISKSMRGRPGRPMSEAARQHLRELNTGKRHSEETKRKMSICKKGVKLSALACKHISESKIGTKNPFYGKHHTEEFKRNHSEFMRVHNPFRGKHHTDEQIKKAVQTRRSNNSYNAWNKGVPCRQETRQRISEANKGKIYVNNGTKNTMIRPDDLQKMLDLGYVKGRICTRDKNRK